MMGHCASLLCALAAMAAAADRDVASFSFDRSAVGQKFEIQTADQVYRGELVDPSTGECQLASSVDGQNFTPAHTVYLLGATVGPQGRQMLVLMHEVKVGQKLELGVGDLDARNRQITSEVKSIKLGG